MMMLFVVAVNAQESRGEADSIAQKDSGEIFYVVETIPEFPGGTSKMMTYIIKNLDYPKQAKDDGIEGKVFVKFVVEKDGKVSNVNVIKGVHPLLDSAAVQVVRDMPDWKPGTQRGTPVRVQFTLPIVFRLDADTPKKK